MRVRFLIPRTFAVSQMNIYVMIMYLKKNGFDAFLKYFSFANFLIVLLIYIVIFAKVGSLVSQKVTNLVNHQTEVVSINYVK